MLVIGVIGIAFAVIEVTMSSASLFLNTLCFLSLSHFHSHSLLLSVVHYEVSMS